MSPSRVATRPRLQPLDAETWATDPRPDLIADSAAWSQLLSIIWDATGGDTLSGSCLALNEQFEHPDFRTVLGPEEIGAARLVLQMDH